MRGGAPRVVWQTLDTDPRLVSAKSAAQHLDQIGRPAHLVWNPLTREIVQLVSALRAGCRLGGADGSGPQEPVSTLDDRGSSAGSAVGTEGRVCIQIAVVALSWEPFTDGPLCCLEPIISWLDSWHVPRRWPAGRPSRFEQAHAGPRSRRLWASGGHFGASQVPTCAAVGPGAIDIELLTGPDSAAAVGAPRETLPHADPAATWATTRAVAPVRLAGAAARGGAAGTPAAHAATPVPAAASAAGSPAASGMR
jgi:hypothetical protein